MSQAIACQTGTGSETDSKSRLRSEEKPWAAQSGSVALLFLRGTALEKTGRPLEALNTYVELLDLDPTHLGALNQLGNLLSAAGGRRKRENFSPTQSRPFPMIP